jgi:ATP-dependent Clp endopeptidase proteolytic subunit ClpP|tara:strand:+ start:2525 stop:3130 length:606 start_codon:yes stop_codon:yes gene_type:complete
MNVIKTFSPMLKEPKLIENLPIIIRLTKFDEASAKAFSSAVMKAQNTGQPVLPVIIDSYGGQVYSLMSMISDIRHSKIPVATIVQGKAMSCGAILFSFGAEGMRYMDPDSTVMIHDVSSMEHGKVEEIKASAEETERLNQKIYHMMAENCGHHKDYFLDIVHQRGHADWFLEADECKKYNLANKLHVPEMKITTEIKFNFK